MEQRRVVYRPLGSALAEPQLKGIRAEGDRFGMADRLAKGRWLAGYSIAAR